MTRHNGGPMGDHREVLHGNHLIPREPNAYIRERRVMGREARHAPPGNRLNQVTI